MPAFISVESLRELDLVETIGSIIMVELFSAHLATMLGENVLQAEGAYCQSITLWSILFFCKRRWAVLPGIKKVIAASLRRMANVNGLLNSVGIFLQLSNGTGDTFYFYSERFWQKLAAMI